MDRTNTVTVTLCCYCLLKLGQAGASVKFVIRLSVPYVCKDSDRVIF